jgi:hypothetical protein
MRERLGEGEKGRVVLMEILEVEQDTRIKRNGRRRIDTEIVKRR